MSKGDFKELATQTKSTGQSFPQLLATMKPQIAAALPKHLNADRMLRVGLTEFRKNPRIGECDVQTVLGALVSLSQLGLEPGVMGQAFLVPYGKVCQGIPGWQGIVDLVSRSGRATTWTGAVRDGDFFEYQLGDSPYLRHRPADDDTGEFLYFYAIGRVKDSQWPIIEVWSAPRVVKHRDRFNKVGKQHYSHENFEMYGRKVVLLQVVKYLPKSVELQGALDLESAADAGVTIDMDAAIKGDWAGTPLETPAQQAPPETTREPAPEKDKPKQDRKAAAADKDSAPPDDGRKDADTEAFTFTDLTKALADAKDEEDCNMIADLIRSVKNEKNRTTLETMLKNKRAQIAKPAAGSDDVKME